MLSLQLDVMEYPFSKIYQLLTHLIFIHLPGIFSALFLRPMKSTCYFFSQTNEEYMLFLFSDQWRVHAFPFLRPMKSTCFSFSKFQACFVPDEKSSNKKVRGTFRTVVVKIPGNYSVAEFVLFKFVLLTWQVSYLSDASTEIFFWHGKRFYLTDASTDMFFWRGKRFYLTDASTDMFF